jgi:predicted nucleic acid-binding protein
MLWTVVHIPPEVEQEVLRSPAAAWLAERMAATGDVYRRCTDRDAMLEGFLGTRVHAGEAAVIAQTDWHQARKREVTPVIDDAGGYRAAQQARMGPMRTGKVLVLLKEAGLITSVAPFLDKLEGAGFFLSARHRRGILTLAGE